MKTRRAKEWLGRGALVLFGLALTVALLETALQVGGVLLGSTTRSGMQDAWQTGHVRILCLGDSNTYGLYVERDQTYPRQFEALWNEKVARPKIEVVNLGYPGTNSTRLLRDFDRIWRTLTPDVVVLMVGVNDFWTEPLPPEGVDPLAFWRRHSRLYRLYLLMRGRVGGEVEVEYVEKPGGGRRMRIGGEEFDFGHRESGRGRGRKLVEQDVLRLIDSIRSRGVPLHVMTYPARTRFYAHANLVIRNATAESETPLVDLAATFDRVCPKDRCPHLLFDDGHPTHAGYHLVAQALLAHLAPHLINPDERAH